PPRPARFRPRQRAPRLNEELSMKSKAAIFTEIGKPLIVDEIEVDDPGPGECLVKLEATGLCHTEIWYMGGGDNVDYEKLSTGVGAVLWAAKAQPGSTAAVFGCGPIGLNVVQGARIAGASKVIAVDLKKERLEKAKELGATDLINAGDYDGNATAAVKELTGGGADYSFEATGNTTVMRQAFESVR